MNFLRPQRDPDRSIETRGALTFTLTFIHPIIYYTERLLHAALFKYVRTYE